MVDAEISIIFCSADETTRLSIDGSSSHGRAMLTWSRGSEVRRFGFTREQLVLLRAFLDLPIRQEE